MKKTLIAATSATMLMASCNTNPLLQESTLPYGAPQFDKIKSEHYMPAFREGIAQAKAEIDAIVANSAQPDFENTIEAMERSGKTLNKVSSIFFNLLEADSDETLQQIAEEVSPLLNDYQMYVSLNEKLFARVKSVWERKEGLGLAQDQMTLLEKTYKSFTRGGANLQGEDRQKYAQLSEQLSLATIRFGRNVLAATNAYKLNITDEAKLAGMPDYLKELGKQTAEEAGQQGWTFDLSYPSYGPFMRFCDDRELRKEMYLAYNSRGLKEEGDNTELVKEIASLRLQIANLLGYETYAHYALEERMLKTPSQVNGFLEDLLQASLPKARKEVKAIQDYAAAHGFKGELQSWDFSYWSEKLKNERYTISDAELKPYFRLDDCIDAVFGLAGKLYGLSFEERSDIPVYHPDVKVYDVKNEQGRHMALFYVDFFPRASKRNGAWMTEFRGQSIVDGTEYRPFVSLVTNFSKPTAGEPSLITPDELETLLHEFGHSLHGMLAEGRYESLCGTNVARDFVELPSQIMENWAYEPEFLQGFAKHYKTGETIPAELIEKISASRNYNAAYLQVRQLNFGILDMAWHDQKTMSDKPTVEFEKSVLSRMAVLPDVPGTAISTSITHLFSGGYAAGYYSYKWSEVLEADAFSLFKEKGIFSREVAESFRANILSKGGSEDEAVMYRNFRGHDPEVGALLRKLGI
ncbi:MAG: M3 family metallopeptidase [Bacteroidales bacterium]|nr:M3 family metallopeptidase [Bacteroidales bacterium]